ncbi:MAG: SCP2 sterol-binding domain-containing protein [Proteobacteria bacterium]|nr:SCP2 sterol-binding domain-containing protein [Pseudomonadota bacterium]
MAQFLSDAWFEEIDKIRAEVGDIPVPDAIKDIVINICVSGHPDGDKELHMAAGDFKQGLKDGAPTTLKVPYEIAKAIFVDGDPAAGMQAFMSGQIQIEGDMSVMMQMQAAGPPSPEAQKLQERVKAMTEA